MEAIADELANLFDQLGKCDKKIFKLKNEIKGAEEFIESVSGSEVDRSGFEQSLDLPIFKSELKGYEDERDRLVESIEQIESDKFGEEIPRTKEGELQVPWERMILTHTQRQVGGVFRNRK